MKGKIKKQVLAVFMSLIFVASFLPVTVAAEEYAEGGLKYNYNMETKTAEVTGYDSSVLPSDVIIPEELTVDGETYTVTSIGDWAFYNCSGLTSVTIPDSVTSIREWAFASCHSLTSFAIPEGVTSIGYDAFADCTGLESITIPGSVTSISNFTFTGCISLTSITIHDGVTSIGNSAFHSCTSLESITIPDGVTSIGVSAFAGCTSLESITIPDGVTSIGVSAFAGCTSLESITIPESITRIEVETFSGCSGLVSVTIPDSVTSIGDRAFYNCSGLTSIIIPDSVTSIGNSVFYNCASLESITIPDNVTSIGISAFAYCASLESITLPDSVTEIKYYAFRACSGLTSIIIPDSVTSIGDFVFQDCTGLTDVYVNEDLTFSQDPFRNLTQQVNVWRYKVDADSEVSQDGKTHVVITAVKDKDTIDITNPLTIRDNVLGDRFVIDKAELNNISIEHEQVTKTETLSPTCTTDGHITYWHCTVCDKYFKNEGLTEEITKEDTILKATGHKYGEPTWSWNEDNSKAEATFTCKDKDDTQVLEATVTSATTEATIDKEGKISYTATVTFEDQVYTDTKEVTLDKLPSEETPEEIPEEPVTKAPVITSGNNSSWNTNSSDGLTFTSDAEYSDFLKVLVDNKEVDSRYYTVKEGSTIVTLSNDFLKTLSVGKHTLSIVSVNGTATATFTIKAASITVPDTGNDITNTYLFSLSAILSLGFISAVLLKKRYSR